MQSCLKILGVLLAGSLLVACNDPTEANEKNFAAAVEKHLTTAAGHVCLGVHLPAHRTDSRLEALEAVGLVSRTEKTYPWGGTAVEFSLSTEGRQFAVERPPLDLCWARRALDHVVKWDIPDALGGPQFTRVEYAWNVVDRADWSKDERVMAAFDIQKTLDDEAERVAKLKLKLTNLGWEPSPGW